MQARLHPNIYAVKGGKDVINNCVCYIYILELKCKKVQFHEGR